MVVFGLLLVDGARTLVLDVRILAQWQPVQATVLDSAAVYEPPAPGGSSVGRGSTTTCRVDPRDSRNFVLVRAPGMGHLGFFAMVALAGGAVVLGLRVRRSFEGRDAAPAV